MALENRNINSSQASYNKGYQHGKADGYKLAKEIIETDKLIPISVGFLFGVLFTTILFVFYMML